MFNEIDSWGKVSEAQGRIAHRVKQIEADIHHENEVQTVAHFEKIMKSAKSGLLHAKILYRKFSIEQERKANIERRRQGHIHAIVDLRTVKVL